MTHPRKPLRLVRSHNPRTLGLPNVKHITNVTTIDYRTSGDVRVMKYIALTDHQRRSGILMSRHHRTRLSQRMSHRLLAVNVLAGLRCGDRLLGVNKWRCY